MCEAVEKAKVKHFLNHNYRRVPAVRLARRLIDEGRVGRIFHWRGAYLQSSIVDPNFPLTWHLRKETAGAGPHIDLNSHSVDLARYLVGEVSSVMAMTTNFIKERPLPGAAAATFSAGARSESSGSGEVTVEDAAFLVAEFANGAIGSFDATRFAPGRKNYNMFEIYGEKGSILFDFERMNELQFFSAVDPEYAQGFRTVIATDSSHDYMAKWWPPIMIGYEHEFMHGVVDFLDAIVNDKPIEPNFRDGLATARILDAALRSASSGSRIKVGG